MGIPFSGSLRRKFPRAKRKRNQQLFNLTPGSEFLSFVGYLNLSFDILDDLTKQYDGFCFEETARQKVFAPWSLLKFMAEPERGLKNYWFESGGKSSVLIQYMKTHILSNPKDYAKTKSI